MSSWVPITEASLSVRMTGPELTALKGAALGAGQTADAVLAETIATVVDEVRGYVAGCRGNKLGPAGTVPPRLVSATVAIVFVRMASRIPGLRALMDQPRVDANSEALRLLARVASCQFAIEDPDNDDPADPGQSPRPVILERPHRFDPCDQEGL